MERKPNQLQVLNGGHSSAPGATLSELPDDDLMLLAVEGMHDAFEVVVLRHQAMVRLLRSLCCIALVSVTFAPRARAAGGTELFGLVIGYNGSSRPDTPPLKYADDDAVKNAQLMNDLGARYALLTQFDGASRELYSALSPQPPTREVVWQALAGLNDHMRKARAAGRSPTLFVFYSGHGDVEHGEGYIELADTRLTRSAFRALLQSAEAGCKW